MAQTIIDSTTQQFLDIHDITNDMVIMKNGTAAVIVSVDAMNFGLLAEEEQDAVMYAYAGLLNSLNYPIQIVIRSQTKDVTGYLGLLKEQEDKATLRINQQRISRYREFVANLIHERNVLDKKFFVVVPASNLELGLLTAGTVVPGAKAFDISSVEKTVIIEKAKNLLEPKKDHLISQFARIGLYSRQLQTQEIIQLFYVSYNPEAAEGQGIDESKSYTTPLVQASLEGYQMNDATTAMPAQAAPTQPAPVSPMSSSPAVEPTTPTSPMPTSPIPVQEIPVMPTTPATPTMPTPPTMPTMPAMPTVPSPVMPMTPPASEPMVPPITTPSPVAEAPVQPTPEPIPPMPPTPGPMEPQAPEPAIAIDVQNDINAVLKDLPTADPSVTTTPTGAAATSDALPPLPEI